MAEKEKAYCTKVENAIRKLHGLSVTCRALSDSYSIQPELADILDLFAETMFRKAADDRA